MTGIRTSDSNVG